MPQPPVCLNMIVKNEAARIERCLSSVLPHVKAVAILDTGSTDGTQDVIRTVCAQHNVPCAIVDGPFEDYSQARNLAFDVARDHNVGNRWCQFALMVDADMELVVEDPNEFFQLQATAPAYDMMQTAGSVTYANRRLVNLDYQRAPYVGPTHEYIDVPAVGTLKGVRFVDHADGSNRTDKYPRDAFLLEQALKREPKNARYWYYLGNTYRDWGQPKYAIPAYEKCIEIGSWDEEIHSAKMNLAACHHSIGNNAGFVAGLVDAYNYRPRRAEPLYDLAKYFREKGDNAASLLFSKTGVNIERPDDVLFVNDFVYSHGLRYEYSVAGYYDEKERKGAFQVANDLALDPSCPEAFRRSARNNLYWNTQPLSHYCPSFQAKRIVFEAPAGYTAMNPSLEVCNGQIHCNIRCVNYRMDELGRYLINSADGETEANGTNPIDTRNFVAQLDINMEVRRAAEVIWHRPPAKYDLVTGLEDIRLYRWHGELWFNACVREQSLNGTCQQARGRLHRDVDPAFLQVSNFEIMSGESQHEKNWMPMPPKHGGPQRWVYRLNTIIDTTGTEKFTTGIHIDDISGSSQLIEFKTGYLCVVHEAIPDPCTGKRMYWHRFAWFDTHGILRRLSLPFVFYERQIEFCAGLAYHPNGNDLLISFGVRDAEAHVARVSIEEVSMLCWKFHES